MSDHKLAEALREIKRTLMQRRCFGPGDLAAWRTAAVQAESDIEEALAAHEAEQQAGEAVAWASQPITWGNRTSEQVLKLTRLSQPQYGYVYPLFTHPQQPLSDAQIEDHRWCWLHGPAGVYSSAFVAGFRKAERAHGIGITKDTK